MRHEIRNQKLPDTGANPMTNQEIIARLERIKPGLENSSSSAEVAMVELLPAVILALRGNTTARPSENIILQYPGDHPFTLWIATYESYDGPESPIGAGKTPTEAVDDLLEMAGDDQ
jgi:hypothetical protein